jgi:hypothetical protein
MWCRVASVGISEFFNLLELKLNGPEKKEIVSFMGSLQSGATDGKGTSNGR